MARKRSAFVPKVIFGVSFGGVIPALLIQACSSKPPMGVAAVAYCCFEASLPDGDASDATEAASDAPSDVATDAVDEDGG